MASKFLLRKLFILYASLFIIGFIIGYDYALITSRQSSYDEKPIQNIVIEFEESGAEGNYKIDEADQMTQK